MNTLGLRASPSEITFCVYDADAQSLVNVEEIRIPNALNTPEQLKYIRATILDVLREYKIQKAGIRLTEPSSRTLSIPRIQVEGVIQEAFASSMLESYYQGAMATIASKVGIPSAEFKRRIKGEREQPDIEGWNEFSEKSREAILTAMGAQNV